MVGLLYASSALLLGFNGSAMAAVGAAVGGPAHKPVVVIGSDQWYFFPCLRTGTCGSTYQPICCVGYRVLLFIGSGWSMAPGRR